MIFEITDTHLQTGMHDETLYPTFVVKKHSDDILEIYNKECKQYTMVTLFDHYNWQSFHVTAEDRDKLGTKKFNEFVEWFGKVSTTGQAGADKVLLGKATQPQRVEGVNSMFEKYRNVWTATKNEDRTITLTKKQSSLERYKTWSHKNYEWITTRSKNTRMVCGVAALCVLMVGSYLLRMLFTTQQMDMFGRNMAKAPPIFFVIFCTTAAVGCTLMMIAVSPTIKRMAKYTRSLVKGQ